MRDRWSPTWSAPAPRLPGHASPRMGKPPSLGGGIDERLCVSIRSSRLGLRLYAPARRRPRRFMRWFRKSPPRRPESGKSEMSGRLTRYPYPLDSESTAVDERASESQARMACAMPSAAAPHPEVRFMLCEESWHVLTCSRERKNASTPPLGPYGRHRHYTLRDQAPRPRCLRPDRLFASRNQDAHLRTRKAKHLPLPHAYGVSLPPTGRPGNP